MSILLNKLLSLNVISSFQSILKEILQEQIGEGCNCKSDKQICINGICKCPDGFMVRILIKDILSYHKEEVERRKNQRNF